MSSAKTPSPGRPLDVEEIGERHDDFLRDAYLRQSPLYKGTDPPCTPQMVQPRTPDPPPQLLNPGLQTDGSIDSSSPGTEDGSRFVREQNAPSPSPALALIYQITTPPNRFPVSPPVNSVSPSEAALMRRSASLRNKSKDIIHRDRTGSFEFPPAQNSDFGGESNEDDPSSKASSGGEMDVEGEDGGDNATVIMEDGEYEGYGDDYYAGELVDDMVVSDGEEGDQETSKVEHENEDRTSNAGTESEAAGERRLEDHQDDEEYFDADEYMDEEADEAEHLRGYDHDQDPDATIRVNVKETETKFERGKAASSPNVSSNASINLAPYPPPVRAYSSPGIERLFTASQSQHDTPKVVETSTDSDDIPIPVGMSLFTPPSSHNRLLDTASPPLQAQDTLSQPISPLPFNTLFNISSPSGSDSMPPTQQDHYGQHQVQSESVNRNNMHLDNDSIMRNSMAFHDHPSQHTLNDDFTPSAPTSSVPDFFEFSQSPPPLTPLTPETESHPEFTPNHKD
ncbi:hypothetical protein CPB84DRAFT_1793303 [Gymnopilus junonius]|uniref:Uncharacterized protein n=1 Tax=Gymnopilus junonius TaxID=109634 RepID=A0A9P5NB52_GYMJU|nr:hypothetical protein CPB84DRAFT_1793303 [Gymnopilus junonius]